MKTKRGFILSLGALGLGLLIAGCQNAPASQSDEDTQAKKLLQGYWTLDDGEAVWEVRGDSIYYPDATSLPVRFWVVNDSLYLEGSHINSYKIMKQADHLLRFCNQSGDEVKLVKGNSKQLRAQFGQPKTYAINTFNTYDADTTVNNDMGYFDSKIHAETTSDPIIKSEYNDQGVEVDNRYLDNMVRVTITNHGTITYQHDFRKAEFSEYIPSQYFAKCMLRGITFSHTSKDALYYDVSIGIPDASTTYCIELRINSNGKVDKRLK